MSRTAEAEERDAGAWAGRLGIPEEFVTEGLLRSVAEDPLFLHHLQSCKDDPAMLELLLGPGRGPGERTFGNAELVARAGVALARWARSGFARATDAVRDERLSVCRGCPHLTAADPGAAHRFTGAGRGAGVCGLCGCDVDRKSRLATEECPDGRWKE
ncbi:hypothetical protein ABT160_20245 [Streptomyces sp. NPDC001941]|uniref:hypothetical protein n=1 Tax=Streptomyces sp. NPDC001941 TaxID=3154659 RepID=UPI00331B2CE9